MKPAATSYTCTKSAGSLRARKRPSGEKRRERMAPILQQRSEGVAGTGWTPPESNSWRRWRRIDASKASRPEVIAAEESGRCPSCAHLAKV